MPICLAKDTLFPLNLLDIRGNKHHHTRAAHSFWKMSWACWHRSRWCGILCSVLLWGCVFLQNSLQLSSSTSIFLVNPAPSLLVLCRGNRIRGTWEWQSLRRERETPQKYFWMPLEFCWNSGTKLWILSFCRIWMITHQCSARSSTGGWLLLMPPRAPLSPRSQLRIRIPR